MRGTSGAPGESLAGNPRWRETRGGRGLPLQRLRPHLPELRPRSSPPGLRLVPPGKGRRRAGGRLWTADAANGPPAAAPIPPPPRAHLKGSGLRMCSEGRVRRAFLPGRGAALVGCPRGSAAARRRVRPSLLSLPQSPAGYGGPPGAGPGQGERSAPGPRGEPPGPERGCQWSPAAAPARGEALRGEVAPEPRRPAGLGLGREGDGGARGVCQPGVVVGDFALFFLIAWRSFADF